MKKKSKKGLRGFQLKVLGYGNSYYIVRVADLEKALAKRPRQFQIDLVGNGEIPADWALLIRSILIQRAPQTQLITNARSSLQGGSVLVWLLGDRRIDPRLTQDCSFVTWRCAEADEAGQGRKLGRRMIQNTPIRFPRPTPRIPTTSKCYS